MLMSMTGFGRAVGDTPLGKLVVEIQSVNRKHLELFVSLPKEWSRFENDIRKWVSEALSRGHVSVRVFLLAGAQSTHALLPDPQMLHELKKGWDRIASQMGLDPRTVDLPFLVSQIPEREEIRCAEESDLPLLHARVDEALQALLKMRKAEAKNLARDLSDRLQILKKELAAIEKIAPEVTVQLRKKLLDKMAEVFSSNASLEASVEERLLREAALLAERADITEEITRLHSHFAQFSDLLQPKNPSVGRKMDFLVQEIGREINTIGSKNPSLSSRVVEMKNELEKMREQIQNIE